MTTEPNGAAPAPRPARPLSAGELDAIDEEFARMVGLAALRAGGTPLAQDALVELLAFASNAAHFVPRLVADVRRLQAALAVVQAGGARELCPRCKRSHLRPVLSLDGTAWEADRCDVCGGSWWFNVPKPAPPRAPVRLIPVDPRAATTALADLAEELVQMRDALAAVRAQLDAGRVADALVVVRSALAEDGAGGR